MSQQMQKQMETNFFTFFSTNCGHVYAVREQPSWLIALGE